MLAMMLPWEIMTPFGVPVEPEVYCSIASVSGTITGEGLPSAATSDSSSVMRYSNASVAKYPSDRFSSA